MGVRRKLRGQSYKVKIPESLAMGFVQEFFMHETDPNKIKDFWNQYHQPLMDWWLYDKAVNVDWPGIETGHLEQRLFARPAMWWIFEAKKPLKHYMVERQWLGPSLIYPNGRPPSPPGCKDEDCELEDVGLYLKRHGLLSELELKTKHNALDYTETTYPDVTRKICREVSKYLKPANNSVCECWECHIDTLSWQEKLGLAYGLDGTKNLYEYLNKEKYLKINKDNPYISNHLKQ